METFILLLASYGLISLFIKIVYRFECFKPIQDVFNLLSGD